MRLTVGLVGVVLAVSLCGCTAPASDGVLVYSDEEGLEWCAPAAQYPEVSFGVPLDFAEGSPITITSVSLVDAVGLKIVESYKMSVDPSWRLQLDTFPPSANFPEEWAAATEITGAKVFAGESVDVIAQIMYLGPGNATATSMRIEYEQDGQNYRADTHIKLLLSVGSCG